MAGHEPEAKGDGDGDIHRTPENNVGGDEGGVRSRGACCAGEGWVYFCIRGLAYIHIVNIE